MVFRLLGPVEAWIGGAAVELGRPKQRVLLVRLLMRANEPVPFEQLVDELWPDSPPKTARHSIQVYVSALRHALSTPGEPARIETRGRAYVLRLRDEELDVVRVRRLLETARRELKRDEPVAAGETVRRALDHWRGSPLADLDDDPSVRDVVFELEELSLEALELRIEADLAVGRGDDLIPELRRLVVEQPMREGLRRHLMLALYRSGRQAEALDAYQQARRSLLHELGLEPSTELKRLEAAILRHDPSLSVEPAELRARRHLPAQPNAFIGRRRELRELRELVASGGVRIVTLTGPGGVGKTRLALAAAEQLVTSFRDGVWLVELASLTDPALVPAAIAQALGVKERPDEPVANAVASHLRTRELLLLADNLEHLPDAVAPLSDLLKQAPGVKLLATSRTLLELYGEHVHEVQPLPLPDLRGGQIEELERNDAVALFLNRAAAARSDFRLTTRNAHAITEVCIRLDGLPLALELAAARLRTIELNELAASLSHRLELLDTGPRDAPRRHRTLRAALEWSHELLDDDAKQVFARLAVFAGTFEFEAAGAICDSHPDHVAVLVDQNLLRRTDAGRFFMLETVREYASECLKQTGEADELRRRHASWFLTLAERANEGIRRGNQMTWLDRLDNEIDNLRAALSWSFDGGESEVGLGLCTSLSLFWFNRDHFGESQQWLDQATARLRGASPDVKARILFSAGRAAFFRNDLDTAQTLLERSLNETGAAEDLVRIAEALLFLSAVASSRSDHERAIELGESALDVYRDAGDEYDVALALHHLGENHRDAGNHRRAEELLAESATLRREHGNLLDAAHSLHSLGDVALDLEEVDRAAGLYGESLEVARSFGAGRLKAYCLAGIAAAAAARADQNRAARLWGAVEMIEETISVPLVDAERARYEQLTSEACRLEPNALAEGRALTIEAAVEYALASVAGLRDAQVRTG